MPSKSEYKIKWYNRWPVASGDAANIVSASTYKEAGEKWLASNHGVDNLTHVIVTKGSGNFVFEITPTGLVKLYGRDARPERKHTPHEILLKRKYLTGTEENFASIHRMEFSKGFNTRRYRSLQLVFISTVDGHVSSTGIHLRPNELNLDAGRFVNFTFDDLPYQFEVCDQFAEDWESNGRNTPVMKMVPGFNGRWSLGFRDISVNRSGTGQSVFHTPVIKFEDTADAMLFKLTYKKP